MKPKQPRQTAEVIALSLLFLAITAFTVVGFAHDWKPPVASLHGEGVDSVITYLSLTTGTILVLGTIIMVAFLWRYGRGRVTTIPNANPMSERLWSLLPVLGMAAVAEAGVMFKGLPVWKQVYGSPPADAVVVELNAQQFEWIVRYPGKDGSFGKTDPVLIDQTTNPLGIDTADVAGRDDVVFRNALHLAVGRTAYVRLRARDVVHSFSIPAFRVKQDVVPGIVGAIKFIPSRAGRYEIACAQLCGMGHYRMGARVTAHPPQEFDTWLAAQPEWTR
ncbi:MAG: cytochrome-c oxidase [Gemmatimonadetes bacterium]|nr:cytochrome-c oxidase [Gemmatimonadota bacterium]